MAQEVENAKDSTGDTSKKGDKPEDAPEELSEEDQKTKDALDALVTQLGASDEASVTSAIEKIGNEIRTATTSMTSVPKPLKFLRPHYATIKEAHASVPSACQKPLADVISVLATVAAEPEERQCLEFRLKGTCGDPGAWGHEYMRHLAGEIAAEFNQRTNQDPPQDVKDLMTIVEVLSLPVQPNQAVSYAQRADIP
jgi:26S proteasome regulatory subunit N1